jgi:heme/copper-type cytochrome/quinol oxidase subunit 1
MPRLSIWFIRSALVYLALGFTFGGLMLFTKGIPAFPILWILLPAHIEFLLTGWTVQLVMGMAFWILPRLHAAPKRGNEKIAWSAYLLINAGMALVVLAAYIPGGQWLLLAGRAAQAGSVALFALQAWPRVKGFGE